MVLSSYRHLKIFNSGKIHILAFEDYIEPRIGVHKCSKIIEYLLKATKSVAQKYTPNSDLMDMMVTFTEMVNRCIKTGLKEDTHNMKGLSCLCYHELRD